MLFFNCWFCLWWLRVLCCYLLCFGFFLPFNWKRKQSQPGPLDCITFLLTFLSFCFLLWQRECTEQIGFHEQEQNPWQRGQHSSSQRVEGEMDIEGQTSCCKVLAPAASNLGSGKETMMKSDPRMNLVWKWVSYLATAVDSWMGTSVSGISAHVAGVLESNKDAILSLF